MSTLNRSIKYPDKLTGMGKKFWSGGEKILERWEKNSGMVGKKILEFTNYLLLIFKFKQ
jgi:hypothetical protein